MGKHTDKEDLDNLLTRIMNSNICNGGRMDVITNVLLISAVVVQLIPPKYVRPY